MYETSHFVSYIFNPIYVIGAKPFTYTKRKIGKIERQCVAYANRLAFVSYSRILLELFES